MKEMIERLIADGWKWVACDKDEMIFIYKNKPDLNIRENFCGYSKHHIPSCLFPDITFENSPVELKTLLVDDEDLFEKQQEELKNILYHGYTHIVKDIRGNLEAVNEKEGYPLNIQILSGLINEKYKLYEVKDLVKKRKVKKSVWYCRQADAELLLFDEKPIRNGGDWAFSEGGNYTVLDNGIIDIDWEDEPIELTYEVEE